MNTCPNCGAQITCGCQERIASNGAKICTNCIANYENMLVSNSGVFNSTQTSSADENTMVVNVVIPTVEYLPDTNENTTG